MSLCDPFAVAFDRLQFEIHAHTDPAAQCDERIRSSVGNIELKRLSDHRRLPVRKPTMQALAAT
jgi:hypothetical protein